MAEARRLHLTHLLGNADKGGLQTGRPIDTGPSTARYLLCSPPCALPYATANVAIT